MAAVTAKAFGEHLPDQVDRIAALSDAQLGLINDVREMYKERAALEKDYATKLSILAKKAADRKNKRMSTLVVGEDPTVAWGEDTLRRSTLENAYSQLVTSIESTAQDYSTLSDVLTSQVADAMKALEKKHSDMKSKQFQFYQRALSDRDKSYNDRLKAKQKYDEECLEIEAYRAKKDRLQDDRHAARVAGQYESQVVDMQNSKNTYIIATAIANSSKDRFYTEDLPLIENDFQRLQTNLITNFINILQHASTLHSTHISTLQSRVTSSQQMLSNVDTAADQNLYVEYNVRPFTTPGDWSWEPCAGYYDTGEMVVEPAPKVFLQNKLQRNRVKLQEAKDKADAKREEVEKLLSIVDTYNSDRGMGDIDDVTNNYLDAQHQLSSIEYIISTLVSENETISLALGGDEGNQYPHSFKSSSFTVPTSCAYCKSSVWKQAKTCIVCKISVHAKCELKIPADCGHRLPKMPGSPRAGSISSITDLSRTDSRKSSLSTHTTKTTPPPTSPSVSSFSSSRLQAHDEEGNFAQVLFEFTPTSAFELHVTEGQSVQILEDDDGSGWVKVADEHGGKGLVPASYVQATEGSEDGSDVSIPAPAAPLAAVVKSSKVRPPPPNRSTKPHVQPKILGSGQYVKGLYTYQASGPDEIDVEDGELIELSAGPSGGQNYADGWWEGYDKNGKKGIFPSNYVTLVLHYSGS